MPGTDPAEAMRVVAGELPDFPFLPELPDRGPGADLTGRTAALLVDMPAEVTPRGWRLAERPGRDLARARSMLASDLDVLEEVLQGFEGPLKIQLCGPWTLAATLELTRTMNVALADPGAVADLTASLAEGAAAYAADVAKRVPGAQAGRPVRRARAAVGDRGPGADPERDVPAGRDRGRHRAGPAEPGAGRHPGVHGGALLCHHGPVRHNPAGGSGRARLRPQPATAGGRGRGGRGGRSGAGVAHGGDPGRGGPPGRSPATRPAAGPETADPGGARETAERVLRLWQRVGLPLATAADQAVITPACGLAGASPAQARAALTRCREAAAMLPELIEETGGSQHD